MIQLTPRVYLVGSGSLGSNLTDRLDCNVYLVDGGEEMALVDSGAGAGQGVESILENVRTTGLPFERLKYLILTHGHGDHSGGAYGIQKAVPGIETIASPFVLRTAANGDERAINLDVAREAGVYPKDYVFHPFKVDRTIAEGDVISVGDLELKCYETPGHCEGHLSFTADMDGLRYMFSGDLVFFGGRVLIQYIKDCNLFDYGRSMEKFKDAQVDVLLPGHLGPSLKDGQSHIDRALEPFSRLQIPPNLT